MPNIHEWHRRSHSGLRFVNRICTSVITRSTSQDPTTQDLRAEWQRDNTEKQCLRLNLQLRGELPIFIWWRDSGWPVRRDMLCYFCSVVLNPGRTFKILLLQHGKKTTSRERINKSKPQSWNRFMMTESIWFWLVILLHFPAVVGDFHHQPNQPWRKHSPHLFSSYGNYIMWLKDILKRAFAEFYLCNADLFHAAQ